MINILDKKNCSGCTSCANICPYNAIKMEPDDEGFLYPKIDTSVCINCGMCEKVCPIIDSNYPLVDYEETYVGYCNIYDKRMASSSGGIFYLLASTILDDSGVVFGAAFDENFDVHHIEVSSADDLSKIMGSKYSQSRLGNTFGLVKKELLLGKKVLFSGTTCQIAGLKKYLKREYDNLLCVDFICLGIPSPKVWSDFRNEIVGDDKINFINFKCKKYGWNNFSLQIKTSKKNYIKIGRKTPFFSAFFSGLISRPSCSKCVFKGVNRVSDITLSDAWGYQFFALELFDNNGLSNVVVHTKKGRNIFENIKKMMVYKNIPIDYVKKYNSNYCYSAKEGIKRSLFWNEYNNKTKKNIVMKKYSDKDTFILKKVLRRIRRIFVK